MDEDQPWQDDWTDSDREFPRDDLVEWETNEVYKDIELEQLAKTNEVYKETDMGSMKGKQEKIDAAFGRIADMIPSGNLLASADPVGFLDTVAAELKDLRAENVKLKGTVSIKQDRVNDLEKALRDTLRQLERAINGDAMDGDWIAAELHGRECLYSQA